MAEFVPSANSKVLELGNGLIREEYEWTVPFQPSWRKKNVLGIQILPTPNFARGSFSNPSWKKGFNSECSEGKIRLEFKLPTTPPNEVKRIWSVESCKITFVKDGLVTSAIEMSLNFYNYRSGPSVMATLYGHKYPKIPENFKGVKFNVTMEAEPMEKELPKDIVEEVEEKGSSEPEETSTSEAKGPRPPAVSRLLKKVKGLLFGSSDSQRKPKSKDD